MSLFRVENFQAETAQRQPSVWLSRAGVPDYMFAPQLVPEGDSTQSF